jgi:hypothetical protein
VRAVLRYAVKEDAQSPFAANSTTGTIYILVLKVLKYNDYLTKIYFLIYRTMRLAYDGFVSVFKSGVASMSLILNRPCWRRTAATAVPMSDRQTEGPLRARRPSTAPQGRVQGKGFRVRSDSLIAPQAIEKAHFRLARASDGQIESLGILAGMRM